jgi:hypothetical protein
MRNRIAHSNTQRRADRLPVLQQEVTGGNSSSRKAIPRRHRSGDRDRATIRQYYLRARREFFLNHGNVVPGVDNHRVVTEAQCCFAVSVFHNNFASSETSPSSQDIGTVAIILPRALTNS